MRRGNGRYCYSSKSDKRSKRAQDGPSPNAFREALAPFAERRKRGEPYREPMKGDFGGTSHPWMLSCPQKPQQEPTLSPTGERSGESSPSPPKRDTRGEDPTPLTLYF